MDTARDGNSLMINRRALLGMGAGFCLSAAVGRAAWALPTGTTAVVETTDGPVQGVVEGGVQTFKGLRYAQAPLGSLRFMPPQKLKPWTQVADATKLGAASMQLRSGGSAASFPTAVGLALNQVFTTSDDI